MSNGVIFDLLIQACAVLFLVAGLWETGNDKVRGPVMAAIAEVFFIVVGVMYGVWSVILVGFIIFAVQSRNAVVWTRVGKQL